MPYISPLKFLEGINLPIEPKLDKSTLRIARQALLAEIDLSPTQTVQMGSSLLTKNDVIQFFDGLQASEHLRYHEAIHADTPLLDFFTSGKIPVQPIANNPIYKEAEFAAFIAPFYPEVFGVAFAEIVETPSFERKQALFALPAAWADGPAKRPIEMRIMQFLRKKMGQLDDIVKPNKGKTGVVFKKNAVARFYDAQLLDTFNRLPKTFEGFRAEYGVLLLELAYIFWNNRNTTESHFIARSVQSIKGNYDLEYQLKHFWDQCTQPNGRVVREESGTTSPWTYIVAIFFIFRIVVAISRCDSSSDSGSRVTLPNYTYEIEEARRQESNERLLEEIGSAREGVRAADEAIKYAEEKKATKTLTKKELAKMAEYEQRAARAKAEQEKKLEESRRALERLNKKYFYDPKTHRPEQFLPLLDSAARANRIYSGTSEYEVLYRMIKADTTVSSQR